MTLVELVLAVVKILIVLLFLLNMAAVATWADRRQSAMVQDRVGPNRAVVDLPAWAVRLIVMTPPALFGVLAAFTAFRSVRLGGALDALTLSLQLGVLVGWFGLLVLTGVVKSGGAINKAEESLVDVDPRSIFYAGVGFHAIGFLITAAVARTDPSTIVLAARVASGALAAVLLVTAFYAASRVPDGVIPIRLAGTLHAAADALKLIWKEDFIPKNADRILHSLAPILAMFPALVTFAVIPFGKQLCFQDDGNGVFGFEDLSHAAPLMASHDFSCARGHAVTWQVADLNVGILYLFAMAGTGVVGAAIAGWASDNKFSLLGGLRAASQMVSYEVAMGLSLVGLFMIYGSVQMMPMVEWQGENAWGIFVQPFGFILFLTALAAECKRVPFDQPEGESEIVAGYFVEYSGMKFGMFYTGEYIELITSSALLTTLFFGGFNLPFLHADGVSVAFGDTTLFEYKMNHVAVVLVTIIAFFAKTILVTWVQIFFRWTLPRFRYDQLMKLGWTKLLPYALGNILVTGIVLLAIDAAGPDAQKVLKVLADCTQALVAIGGVVGIVALIAGLLEPAERNKFLKSTAARFAAAAGGTKSAPQQA